MNNNEEIELNFNVNIFECYKVFKYKYSKSKLSKLKILVITCIPLAIGLLIFIIQLLNNYIEKSIMFNSDYYKNFAIIAIACVIWSLVSYIFHKKRIHILANLENEKHMEGKISYKSKVVLGIDYMTVNSEVFYGRVYYKGIEDIIVFKDIIVILVKPFKLVIIPISAFDNIESRKNFISILSEKIEKKKII